MAKIGQTLNEYGTLVTLFKCEFCGHEFTVCPPVPPDKEDQWRGCLGIGCPSYDPSRDADKFFDNGPPDGAVITKGPVLPLNHRRVRG